MPQLKAARQATKQIKKHRVSHASAAAATVMAAIAANVVMVLNAVKMALRTLF